MTDLQASARYGLHFEQHNANCFIVYCSDKIVGRLVGCSIRCFWVYFPIDSSGHFIGRNRFDAVNQYHQFCDLAV